MIKKEHVVKLGDQEMLLTRYQLKVFLGVLAGKTNREIAEEMQVNTPAVKTHTTNLYKMAGVKSRAEFIYKYRKFNAHS